MSEEHPAETRIADLGITRPEEIDVEAIAYDFGVEVRYDRLSGCEATLIGYGTRGIATIQRDCVRTRQRFSVGHELGHWEHHRGHSFRCRVDDISENLAQRDKGKEQQADDYAAHLLLPSALFKPLVKQIKTPSFAHLNELANVFDCSLLATSLRLIDVGTVPAILTCYNREGLRWFAFSTDVPRRWYLKDRLDEDSFAHDLLFSGREAPGFRKSSADTWFTNGDGDEYELKEHSVMARGGEVLTLIIPSDEMLEARYDPDAFPTKYNERGAYTVKRNRKT